MAGEVIVDALPYIDAGYDEPGVRESALALIDEECRRFRPTKNYLDHLPPHTNSFETKLMTNEFERIQNRQPMETLSMKRYELPPPTAGKLSEVAAWQESVENSMAQLEHQWVRAMNLELMLEYGIEAWKVYLEVFVAMQAKAQVQLQQIKKEIQDINWQRKQAQTQAGEKLKSLEANWVLLVSKNYEIEQECAKLEKHVNDGRVKLQRLTLRHQKIEELKRQKLELEQKQKQAQEREHEREQEQEQEERVQEQEQLEKETEEAQRENDASINNCEDENEDNGEEQNEMKVDDATDAAAEENMSVDTDDVKVDEK